MSYSPWGHKELDTTEQLTHIHLVLSRHYALVLIWMRGQVKVKSLSCVLLFATPWTVAYQASPSMGFFRQEYWSGLPFPFPGDERVYVC